VRPPAHGGFGSTVIEAMAKQTLWGEVQLDYAPTGLVWALICPAAKALDIGSAIEATTAKPCRAYKQEAGRHHCRCRNPASLLPPPPADTTPAPVSNPAGSATPSAVSATETSTRLYCPTLRACTQMSGCSRQINEVKAQGKPSWLWEVRSLTSTATARCPIGRAQKNRVCRASARPAGRPAARGPEGIGLRPSSSGRAGPAPTGARRG
jgi:hypothetical protein